MIAVFLIVCGVVYFVARVVEECAKVRAYNRRTEGLSDADLALICPMKDAPKW